MSDTGAPGAGVRYGTPNVSYFQRLAATRVEDDGPFWMVNLMKYRVVADYVDGSRGLSGREADDLYTPFDVLAAIGAEVVFAAEVEAQLLGDAPAWDRVGIVRYPSRRAFMAMQQRPDFQAKHVHKDAGMEQTIVMACLPMALEFAAPTAEREADSFMMMHVMKYAEGGREAMREYEATSGAAGLALGVRPEAWLAVEGTIVGNGREWDEVRLNRFPSKAIFAELVSMEVHKGGRELRQGALEDTYTMMLAPVVDRLGRG